MRKIIFTDPNSRETEISADSLPGLFDSMIRGFPGYWKSGNCACDFELFENDVLMKRLSVGFYEELGLCLTYEEFYDAVVGTVTGKKIQTRLSEEYLAVYDRDKLDETVDIYYELYVSKGLLMPPELAWKGIEYFVKQGGQSNELEWITPDDIPEEGNWC